MLKDWSDIYRIGIPTIDAQHRGFFIASHRLYEDILNHKGSTAVVEAVTFMREYAHQHFKTEEAFMRKHEYPNLAHHLELHAAFFRYLDELELDLTMIGPTPELANRALDVTQDWLIDHIADEDMLYTFYIKPDREDDREQASH